MTGDSLPDHSGARIYWCDGVLPERSDAFPVRVVLGSAYDRLRAENEALKAERDRAVETRENANTVSVRVEGENRALRAENEALSRDYGTLDRLVQDIEQYALTPEAVLRSIEQAWRAIEDRAAVEIDETEASG